MHNFHAMAGLLSMSDEQALSLIQQVTNAGGVAYWDARKADGTDPLTGNSSPWVDLINSNDATLDGYAGDANEGWQSNPNVLRGAGSNEWCRIASIGSELDITTSPIAIGMTIKAPTGGANGYVFTKNANTSSTIQYGVICRPSTPNCSMYIEGSSKCGTDITLDVWFNLVFYWDGSGITSYINGTQASTGVHSGTLTSRANAQIGARSSANDGLSQSSEFEGDMGHIAIYADFGTDIASVLAAEANVAADYLALNP